MDAGANNPGFLRRVVTKTIPAGPRRKAQQELERIFFLRRSGEALQRTAWCLFARIPHPLPFCLRGRLTHHSNKTFVILISFAADIYPPVGLDFGGNWIPVISPNDSNESEGWSPCRWQSRANMCMQIYNKDISCCVFV
jgi:hypothetical protein